MAALELEHTIQERGAAERRLRRYFQIGGLTIEVRSDLPIPLRAFDPKFASFEVEGPSADTIVLHHHFGLPEAKTWEAGREIYRRPPWTIRSHEGSWIYVIRGSAAQDAEPRCVALLSGDYRRIDIYHCEAMADWFLRGKIVSLTSFPTDQVVLAQAFADRRACLLHSAAAILDGKGLLFVGHSEAGKSTTVKMLEGRAEILCDDRNVVRLWPDGFRVHGTWSHGEVAAVSASGAPLRAILFLRKSAENRLTPAHDRKTALARLLACLIKPLVSVSWWEKSLETVAALVREVPCYEMHFDRSGRIVGELERLTQASSGAAEEFAP